jgi:hypothetical protein
MTRVCSLIVLGWAGAAFGQQPYPLGGVPYYQPPPGATSVRPPLSPYLNLLNGNNPALNYYYGVRPFTAPPGSLGSVAPGGYGMGGGGSLYVQPQPPQVDPLAEPKDPKAFRLPSPGNPVVFGNKFGSSRAGVVGPQQGVFSGPTPLGVAGGGQQAGGQSQGAPATIPRSR